MTATAQVVRALAGRTAVAGVLGARHARARRRCPPRPVGTATSGWAAPVLAAAAPAAVVCGAVRGGGRLAAPASAAGRTLLAGHVLAGAALEELLWRAPLANCPSGRRIVLSVVGFAGLHALRDGIRSLPVHAATTCSWTASVLVGHTVRWSILSHAAYNYLAHTLRHARWSP